MVQSGITVVASAGNANRDACNGSPGHLSEVITVAATDAQDARYYVDSDTGSNYGPCVDLFAPGVDIVMAHKDGGSAFDSGTSMSTAFVSGVVALYLQENPGWTPANVKHWITWRATQGPNLISNGGAGSPQRLLFSLEPLNVGLISPNVDGPGDYKWQAVPSFGVGHYSYQWYHRWVYGDGSTSSWEALGTQSEQWVTVNFGDPQFEIRVDVVSGTQTETRSELVTDGCGDPIPCVESGGWPEQ